MATAALKHPHQAGYHVTPTIGIDELILDLLAKRSDTCRETGSTCDVCRGSLRSGEPGIEIPAAEH